MACKRSGVQVPYPPLLAGRESRRFFPGDRPRDQNRPTVGNLGQGRSLACFKAAFYAPASLPGGARSNRRARLVKISFLANAKP